MEWGAGIPQEICVCIGIRNTRMCMCAIFGSQNTLSMHVCKFSKGNACDLGSKYALEVHIRDLGNEDALIVHECNFS